MLFSSDSNSLWIACGQSSAQKPDDAMAIGLNVPEMQVLDIRRYGQAAESGPVRGLERIGDSVWAWQFDARGTSFRIRDLTHDREIVTVQTPTLLDRQPDRRRPATAEVDEKTIRLNFCGVPPRRPGRHAAPHPGYAACSPSTRRLESLIGGVDKPDHRIPNPSTNLPKRTLSGHGLRIDAFWQYDSKTGELVVTRQRHRPRTAADHLDRAATAANIGRWPLAPDHRSRSRLSKAVPYPALIAEPESATHLTPPAYSPPA